MTINISVPETDQQLKPRITVIGVGGAGGNAVNNMINARLDGVEFVVANTDAQALSQSLADRRLQLGSNCTQGLGAGSRPEIGRAAAEEVIDDIVENLLGSNMVFITAGMGGGTGTGAAPVIARQAREQGILTVGVVTKPFQFEGTQCMRIAEAGIEEMQHYVDTLIIIPNQNLFRVATENTTFAAAFSMADNVLYSGVRGVTDLMVVPGLINLDFADIRSIMGEMGKAMMGTGEAEGEDRAKRAAESAISNPLLDDVSMKGARGVLINITGGPDMTLFEVDEAANRIGDEVDEDATIIFGSTLDNDLEGTMRVSVVATGIDVQEGHQPQPLVVELFPEESRAKIAAAGGASGASQDVAAVHATNIVAPPESSPAEIELAATSRPGPIEETMSEFAPQEPVPAADEPLPEPQSFIGPPAVTPGTRMEPSANDPDPFKAADLINGRRDMTKGRGRVPSLFRRMTGTGRSKPKAAAPDESKPVPTNAPGAQPEKTGPEEAKPEERLPISQTDEDLLDIPAFLRRQAN